MENKRSVSLTLWYQLIKVLAQAANQFQAKKIQGDFILGSYFLLDFLGVVLPALSMMKPNSTFFQACTSYLQYYQTSIFNDNLILQICFNIIFLLFPLMAIILILTGNKRHSMKGSLLLLAYFSISHHLFILQAQQIALNLFGIIFGALNMTIGILACLVFTILRSSYSCKGINGTLIFPWKCKIFIDIASRILVTILPFVHQSLTKSIRIGWISLALTLVLIELYLLLSKFIYFTKKMVNLQNIAICGKASTLLLTFIQLTVEEPLLLNNFLIVSLSTFLFSHATLERYLEFQREEIQMKDLNKIDKTDDVLLLIHAVMKTFLKQENKAYAKSQIIVTNFKHNHMNQCQDIDCFCQTLSPQSMQRAIINHKLQLISQSFRKNFSIVSFINYIRLEEFEVYATVYSTFAELKMKHQTTFLSNFIEQKSYLHLQEFLNKKNSMLQTVNIERIIEADHVSQNLQKLIIQSTCKKVEFWEKNYRGIMNSGELQINLDDQLKNLKIFYQKQQEIYQKYQASFKCLDLLAFKYRFLDLKTKIPVKLKKSLQKLKLKKEISSHAFERGAHGNQQISIQMHTNTACLLESKIDVNQMGIISNCSKTVKEVFGIDKISLKKLHINKLMPKSMHEQHDKILKKWINSGSWDNTAKIRYIYAVTSKQVCFESAIYLRIFQKIDGLSLMSAFFKFNDQDYLLINPKGEIDGAGLKFLEMLGKKILGLPFRVICDQKSIQANTGNTSKISKFFSLQGNQSQVQQYLEKKGSQITNQEEFTTQLKTFTIQYSLNDYHLGSAKFKILKLIKVIDIDNNYGDQNEVKSATKQISLVEEDNNFILNCGESSVTSSVNNIELTIQQTFQNMQHLFHNPKQIKDQQSKKILILLFIFSSIGIGLMVLQILTRLKTYQNNAQILFGARMNKLLVNKLQVLYEQTVTMMLLSPEHSELRDQNLIQLRIVNDIHYKIIQASHKAMNGPLKQIFDQLNQFPQWTTHKNQSIAMRPTNFITYFIFHLMEINSKTLALAQQSILTLKNNYIKIIQFNKDIIKLYSKFAENISFKQICILMGINAIFLFFYLLRGYMTWRIQKIRLIQNDKIIYQMGFIDKANVEILKNYYIEMKNRIENTDNISKNSSTDNSKIFKFKEKTKELAFIQRRQTQNRFPTKPVQMTLYRVLVFSSRFAAIIILSFSVASQLILYSKITQVRNKVWELFSYQNLFIANAALMKDMALNGYQADKFQLIENNYLLLNSSNSSIINTLHDLDQILKSDSDDNSFLQLLKIDLCHLIENYTSQYSINQCKNSQFYETYQKGFLVTLSIEQNEMIETFYSIKGDDMNFQEKYQNLFQSFSGLKFLAIGFYALEEELFEKLPDFMEKEGSRGSLYIQIFFIGLVALTFLTIRILYVNDQLKKAQNFGKVTLIPLSVIRSTKFMGKEMIEALDV